MIVKSAAAVDLSGIQDVNVRAVVALAATCGWNVVKTKNAGVTLIARDNMKKHLPDNSGIRSGLLAQTVASCFTHKQDGLQIELEAIEDVIDMVSPPKETQRLMLRVWGEVHGKEWRRPKPEKQPEPEPEVTYVLTVDPPLEKPTDEQFAVVDAEPYDEPVPSEEVEPPPYIVSEAPLTVMNRSHQYVPSDSTIERKWSDGHVDYKCAFCGEVSPNKQAFTSRHKAKHIAEGRATRSYPTDARTTVSPEKQPEPDLQPQVETHVSDGDKLKAILEIVSPGLVAQMENDYLEAIQGIEVLERRIIELELENRDLREESKRSRSNLEAARALLGEL